MKTKLEILVAVVTLIASLATIYAVFFGENIYQQKTGRSIYDSNPTYTVGLPSAPPASMTAIVSTSTVSALPPSATPLLIDTPTLIPQPTVQTARPATYTLRTGETTFCLARRFNVDPGQLLALNGLFDSETIQPGFVVKIPPSGNFPGPRALRAHPTTYTVQTDDTIYSIACLYGDVDPMNVIAVNHLSAPYNLTAGQVIQIP